MASIQMRRYYSLKEKKNILELMLKQKTLFTDITLKEILLEKILKWDQHCIIVMVNECSSTRREFKYFQWRNSFTVRQKKKHRLLKDLRPAKRY